MFSYQQIQRYNETDTCIYRYITANMDKVPYMTIRELAREIHVSAATILRFCNKHDFQGYGQFKDALKMELEARAASRPRTCGSWPPFSRGPIPWPLRKSWSLRWKRSAGQT